MITDEVMEAARDGLDYAEVEQRGYEILAPADVLDDVPRLVGRIELEALFADGHRLIVLHDPITGDGPPPLAATTPEPQWLEGGMPLAAHEHVRCPDRADLALPRVRGQPAAATSIAGPPGACGWRSPPA